MLFILQGSHNIERECFHYSLWWSVTCECPVCRLNFKQRVDTICLSQVLEPGDQILADKGYRIQDLLEPLQCTLAVPAYLSSKGQFSKEEIRSSKAVHNLRVHVERAISRVKEFHLFDGIIPLTMAGSINQLWTVASLLTDFHGPLFYEHKPWHFLLLWNRKTLQEQ